MQIVAGAGAVLLVVTGCSTASFVPESATPTASRTGAVTNSLTVTQLGVPQNEIAGSGKTVADLPDYGDWGLGIIESEPQSLLIGSGGTFYEIKENTGTPAPDDAAIDWAVATRFEGQSQATVTDLDWSELLETIGATTLPFDFTTFQVTGTFDVTVNSSPTGQRTKKLKKQFPSRSASQVAGTLVGLWQPEFTGSAGLPDEVTAFFISDDGAIGGRVEDVTAVAGELESSNQSQWRVLTPNGPAADPTATALEN